MSEQSPDKSGELVVVGNFLMNLSEEDYANLQYEPGTITPYAKDSGYIGNIGGHIVEVKERVFKNADKSDGEREYLFRFDGVLIDGKETDSTGLMIKSFFEKVKAVAPRE